MAPAHPNSVLPSERSPLLPRDTPQVARSPDSEYRTREHQQHNAEAGGEDGENGREEEEAPTMPKLMLMFTGIMIAAFLFAVDSTLMATLAAPIAGSFDSLTLLSWFASAYFIANAISQPLAGKLTDIYGRKLGMILSNVLFGVGNAMCALAQSEKTMIAGRVVAGIGGGGIGPIATIIVSDLVPLRKRGVWQGFMNVSFGVGSSLGGPIGGLINDTLGWRWAFWLQMPFTALAVLLVALFLNPKQPAASPDANGAATSALARHKRVDYPGALLLVSSLTLFLLGLIAGGDLVPWDHPLVLSSLPLSAALLGLFIYVELRVAAEPIILLPLLATRTTFFACLANFLVTAARFGLLFNLPLFLLAQGFSASAAGLRLIPESVAVGLTSLAAGLIMRATGRYYALGCAIAVIFTVGIALPVLFFDRSTPAWLPFVDLALVGTGYSGMQSVTIIALIAAVEHKHQAIVTSTSYAFRSTGTTLGIAVAGAVFQNRLRVELLGRLEGREDEAEKLLRKIRDRLDAIRDLEPRWREVVVDSYVGALKGVFLVLWVIGVAGAATLFLLKEHKLYKTLGRRDAD